MEEERLEIEKETEKKKEKDAEIAFLKIAAAKNIPEPSGSAVSQADAPEPTAGAMEQPTSNNDKIRK